ncbi:AraC family transcriptional regulator [Paenibacillus sp. MBLB4367]|uniref:AraC family transcriptional regulator n=1 Tax=Paenibacillus sp. MBLB4367 TaxID=3384767 RepID=UPI003907FE55
MKVRLPQRFYFVVFASLVLPSIVFSVILYQKNVTKAIGQKLQTEQLILDQYEKQIRMAYEQILEKAGAYGSDGELNELAAQFPHAGQVETLRLINKLDEIRLSNPYIRSIVFLHENADQALSVLDPSTSGFRVSVDPKWRDVFRTSRQSLEIMPTVASPDSGSSESVLSSIGIRMPYYSLNKTSMMLINVDIGVLIDQTTDMDWEDRSLYFVNDQGLVLRPLPYLDRPFSGLFASSAPPLASEAANEAAAERFDNNGKTMLRLHKEIQSFGGMIVKVAPEREWFRTEYMFKLVIIAGNVVWFLLSLAVARFLSQYLYGPLGLAVAGIKRMLSGEQTGEKPAPLREELESIRFSVETMLTENKQLSQTYRKFLPQIKDRFFFRLFTGQYTSVSAIEEQLALLALPIEKETLGLVVMELDFPPHGKSEEQQAVRLLFLDLFENLDLPRSPLCMVEVGKDRWAAAFVATDMEDGEFNQFAFALCKEMQEQAENRLAVAVSCGVGKSGGGLLEVGRCFEQICDLFKYKISLGTGIIMNIQERAGTGEVPPLRQLKLDSDKIPNLLITGSGEQAWECAEAFLAPLQHYPDPARVQEQLVKLLHTVITVLDADPGARKELLGDDRHVYEELLRLNNWPAVKAWFHRLIDSISGYYSRQTTVEVSGWAGKISSFVQTHYANPDLSMTLLSETFDLSTTYIGRVFKKDKGISLLDYINALRIDRAKALLVDTDLKIYEIGEKVGFKTGHYFIKLFKEQTGLTPGEYRDGESRLRTGMPGDAT